jgi:hypothetical protein
VSRSARAPEGQHTMVSVFLTLENGTTREHVWDTPMALFPALHKAPRWAKAELRRDEIRGRSKIVRMDVIAQYRPGRFTRR